MASNEEREAPLEPSVSAALQQLPPESRARLDANILAVMQGLAQRGAAAEERAARERQLNAGTYYATFDEVWNGKGVPYSYQDYVEMMRNGHPSFDVDRINNFRVTLDNALLADRGVTDSSETSRGSQSRASTRTRFWPVDIFHSKFEAAGNVPVGSLLLPPEAHNQDQRGVEQPPPPLAQDAEVAHLVPASPILSSLYHHVARWVFGIPDENVHYSVIQKLIHGIEGEDQKRIKGTGLKHFPCNKIQLRDQYAYFDKEPCLVIVPVLDLAQAKAWRGEGYHALVMVSSGKKGSRDGSGNAATGIGMLEQGEEATTLDIDCARSLLEATLKGLAFATLEKSKPTDRWVQGLGFQKSKTTLVEIQRQLKPVDGSAQVIVPKMSEQVNQKPVRKITFGTAYLTGTNCHRAPDPLLLAIKSAINWSRFHEQQLMAAGERDESDAATSDTSRAELEYIMDVEEQYERSRQEKELLNTIITIPTMQIKGV